MSVKRVLVLGGYGKFGKRIIENLSHEKDIILLIAGRNEKKANELITVLKNKGVNAEFESIPLDINSPSLVEELRRLKPHITIHTSGPFQGQDYKVPEACIAVGSHYIDLADDRRFVCDINTLNEKALSQGVLVVSGASSVPGLSSVVVDHFAGDFAFLNEIDIAIAPGNKAERGEATVRGILSYTGHGFPVLEQGEWGEKFGWMSPRKLNFGNGIGKRWLANVDVPDLELLPQRYSGVQTVNFQAGLELPFLHFGMVFMAFLAKRNFVKDWSIFTPFIFKSSEIFKCFGTDTGAMQVRVSGLNQHGKTKTVKWTLHANNNIGPYIPTLSAIILAKKLLHETALQRGATPCLGLYELDEFDEESRLLGIHHETEVLGG